MKHTRPLILALFSLVLLAALTPTVHAQGAQKQRTPMQAVLDAWTETGAQLVAMAEDWSADKYTYRLNADVRTFQQVLLHVAGSNYDLVNRLTGTKMGDGRNDPAVDDYKTKEQTVAFLKKSIADGAAEIKKEGDAGVSKHLYDWIGYTEHMGEHYGLLVAYYRSSGIVPPSSRPKK